MNEEYDLKDYNPTLDYDELQKNLNDLKEDLEENEKQFHPLARKSQPFDWCQALQFTS